MNPISQRIRASILEVLNLLSDVSAQRAYEQRVPIADVELVCMWFDDTYLPESAEFQSAFSPKELRALAELNELFDSILEGFGGTLPPLLELHSSASWGRLSFAARSTAASLAP